jgi:hypothetical protein
MLMQISLEAPIFIQVVKMVLKIIIVKIFQLAHLLFLNITILSFKWTIVMDMKILSLHLNFSGGMIPTFTLEDQGVFFLLTNIGMFKIAGFHHQKHQRAPLMV